MAKEDIAIQSILGTKSGVGADDGLAHQNDADVRLKLAELARELGVQRQKLNFLLEAGVPIGDLEGLINLRQHTTTVSRGPNNPNKPREREATYEQLLRLYRLCWQDEGENWLGLAERIVEYALSCSDDSPKNTDSNDYWTRLNQAMGLYQRIGERMFSDEY